MPSLAIRSMVRSALVAMTPLFLAACAVGPAAPVAAAPVAASPAPEPDAAEIALLGERLFQERCSTCHDAGRAPPRTQIAANSRQQILEALDTGFMAPIAMFMSTREKTILARHLSGVAN